MKSEGATQGYSFTTDWFSSNIPNIERSLQNSGLDLAGPLKMLEIGSFEGRSTCWFMERFPNLHITCVDNWEGAPVPSPEIGRAALERFRRNMGICEAKIGRRAYMAIPSTSATYLSSIYACAARGLCQFDIIYIDGSHDAADVFVDAGLAFTCCKPGGVILFDDYLGGDPVAADRGDIAALKSCPKPAIDGFLRSFNGRYKLLHYGYQLHLVKNPEIGILPADASPTETSPTDSSPADVKVESGGMNSVD